MSGSRVRRAFAAGIPKADLHCHLEGVIEPATAIELAEKNDVALPFDTVGAARDFLDVGSLETFLEAASEIAKTMQTAADVERVTVELGADSARQTVPYREVFVGYTPHERRGLDWEAIVEGVTAGRERAMAEYGVDLRFIPCVTRTAAPDVGVELVERAHAAREEIGTVGIGLAGAERGNPAHRHAAAFERASELGLNRVAHAGEAAGPGSVWDALVSLDVDRIDHGVRAAEDDILIDYLTTAEIPLTTCPISNVELNVYPQLSAHPVVDLYEDGVVVTVNSDDPALFGADLTENYVRVAEVFDLAPEDILALARNSFEVAFCGPSRTSASLRELEDEAERLRADLGL